MSGCGNSGCSCGAACKCASGNSCCAKRSMDDFESSEMRGFEGANEGCKCGDKCSCNPCNCK
ncbi:hypothetical protein MPTK1_4g12810 [Marchantia polymorpha subsp. ruderalis]|uniref:Metallothionein-like protein n=2 Tax=Marchantia polymorpha TaxID=3197 RepID=A0AAF6B9A7_MARPO|nr:hypothetical protein MARPO_0138s0017 [Marchantia polymorpha]PTQ29578.1 hypothetical protein MARPO_0138s0018 [Marchantia polymorpha]BBN08591.1 hypothetical protein Mp_4g12800 [Marchantia polymorpha subsp. ruderalis]BBN08592.1 hypothetical protein Mp_4g12810 [Marchantia polymorpha subsp. ruderalis]|eukprot:PTQ29577.1 hypothetical protein MARPO_0138s0017 [Marchantia polymorpha]